MDGSVQHSLSFDHFCDFRVVLVLIKIDLTHHHVVLRDDLRKGFEGLVSHALAVDEGQVRKLIVLTKRVGQARNPIIRDVLIVVEDQAAKWGHGLQIL